MKYVSIGSRSKQFPAFKIIFLIRWSFKALALCHSLKNHRHYYSVWPNHVITCQALRLNISQIFFLITSRGAAIVAVPWDAQSTSLFGQAAIARACMVYTSSTSTAFNQTTDRSPLAFYIRYILRINIMRWDSYSSSYKRAKRLKIN